MKIDNMVKPSANVVRIVGLDEGDVYKRVDKPTYGQNRVLIGVVRQVLVSEEGATVVGHEYEVTYDDVKIHEKVMVGDDDLMMYPATPEEVAEHIDRMREAADRKVQRIERELEAAQESRLRLSSIESDLRNNRLSAPVTQSIEGEVADGGEG